MWYYSYVDSYVALLSFGQGVVDVKRRLDLLGVSTGHVPLIL